jgi:hypothetical protein
LTRRRRRRAWRRTKLHRGHSACPPPILERTPDAPWLSRTCKRRTSASWTSRNLAASPAGTVPAPAGTSPTAQRLQACGGAKCSVVDSTGAGETRRPLTLSRETAPRLRTDEPSLVRVRDHVARPVGPRLSGPVDHAVAEPGSRGPGYLDQAGPLVRRGPNLLPWPACTKPVRWSSPS